MAVTDVVEKFTVFEQPGELCFIFFCPGCKENHSYRVGGTRKPNWTWNGSMNKPTFRASLLYPNQKRCHLLITDGIIEFYSDCTHELAGKTVPMEPIET